MAPKQTEALFPFPVGNATALGVDLEPIKAASSSLRKRVDARKLPGFMCCVVKDGQLLHFDAYGLADVSSGLPMSGNVLFRLYSQTKAVTLVGFMRLLELGLVCLDEPLSKYVPSFAKTRVGDKLRPAAREIQLRDLVGHTSGVGFGPGFGYAPENDYETSYVDLVRRVDQGKVKSLAEWAEELGKLPLRFQPGKDWGYGYSSDLLGRVVEVVTGRELDEYLQSEVIKPLGMKDTFFEVPSKKSSRLSALYSMEPWDGKGNSIVFVTVDPGGSGLVDNKAKGVQSFPSDGNGIPAPSASAFLRGRAATVIQGGGCVCSIAGGLVSTLGDYARFGQMILNEGVLDGRRILQPENVRLLARDWLNDYSVERRKRPLWVWNTPGIGFSPLGQIGLPHPEAKGRRSAGAALNTVHWGGAGGSGYMFNWPHRVMVLTYTGLIYDTNTQKTMWRAAFSALRSGGARPLKSFPSAGAQTDDGVVMLDCSPPGIKRSRNGKDSATTVDGSSRSKKSRTSSVQRKPAAA
eukprot:TRINITY_DN48508_c0_g1_i1.p1 TRINITY_DN48508_c0_g1~~TRINITY_DN48508_c0_g1_i1.p1  ORF type:complete len:530 (+),score=73.58 TRINITY_DN48508_c0_g1_i1:31-1590(+)